MIAICSDTHGTDAHRLAGAARSAVESSSAVVHAGDFTTVAVLDAFESVAERLVAVRGNGDGEAVRTRLPATATAELEGLRIALAHGHEHDETGLAMLGRQEGADLVVAGHSHRAGVVETGQITLLNPGSHAEPRGGIPTHAELEAENGTGWEGRIISRDGEVIETFVVRT